MQLEGYEIESRIGEGGMATVYLGRQLSLERPVAIKVLSQGLLADDVVREAFEREARLVASLNHPHIIHVIDRGVTPQGQPYFVMEYVEGVDLARAIRINTLSFQRKLALCLQICQAISYAHHNGIIHRDIKPANVIVDRQGNARVLDFGIAMLAEEVSAATMGTENYMAPELLEDNGRQAGAKSDIYSLGMTMYELFAGFRPHRASLYQPIAHMQAQFPPALDNLLSTCLDAHPDHRPASAQALYQQLLHVSAGKHLSTTQKQRARENVGKKNHLLLDVLKEKQDGVVYLFEEQNSRQLLVLKKCSVGSGGLREAQRLLHLAHPHLARVLGVSGNERIFVVAMEYLAGGTLAERLITPWDPARFFPVARGMATALQCAAQNGLHHGQLRPSNVMFTADDIVKVADFGFASDNSADQASYACQTVTGRPPLDEEHADVFSMGVMFHEMLTGEKPTFKQGKLKPSRHLRQLPKALETLLLRILDVDRHATCKRFAELVSHLDAQQSEADTMIIGRTGSARALPAWRQWLPRAAIVVAALLLAGALAANIFQGLR